MQYISLQYYPLTNVSPYPRPPYPPPPLSPEHVYTFEFYQHMLCPRRFALDLGVIRFDIAKVAH